MWGSTAWTSYISTTKLQGGRLRTLRFKMECEFHFGRAILLTTSSIRHPYSRLFLELVMYLVERLYARWIMKQSNFLEGTPYLQFLTDVNCSTEYMPGDYFSHLQICLPPKLLTATGSWPVGAVAWHFNLLCTVKGLIFVAWNYRYLKNLILSALVRELETFTTDTKPAYYWNAVVWNFCPLIYAD